MILNKIIIKVPFLTIAVAILNNSDAMCFSDWRSSKAIGASTFPLEKEDGIRMSIGVPVGRVDGYC